MNNQKSLGLEEGFFLYLLEFCLQEWGAENLEICVPSDWKSNCSPVPASVEELCDFSTESVVLLKINCGNRQVTYHSQLTGQLPGFFTQKVGPASDHSIGR